MEPINEIIGKYEADVSNNNMNEFSVELVKLINKYSIENYSNTPDWILADYLMNCLEAFHAITDKKHYYNNSIK